MNIFSLPYANYYHSPQSYYRHVPVPSSIPLFYHMSDNVQNTENFGVKRNFNEMQQDAEDDSMDEYSVCDDEPSRKRTKFLHRLQRLQLQNPEQITVSLRGNNQQPVFNLLRLNNGQQVNLLNDFNLQHQEYIRKKDYQHMLETKKKEESKESGTPEVVDREILFRNYGGINSLLRCLHIERSTRSPAKQ
jgi:hypothetical protein